MLDATTETVRPGPTRPTPGYGIIVLLAIVWSNKNINFLMFVTGCDQEFTQEVAWQFAHK